MANKEKLIKQTLELTKQSYEQNKFPCGAVLIKDDEILFESVSPSKILHAEINLIQKASEKLNTIDLNDMTLYTATEPCIMCLSAAVWSNLKQIYYLARKESLGEFSYESDLVASQYFEATDSSLQYDFIPGYEDEVVGMVDKWREKFA